MHYLIFSDSFISLANKLENVLGIRLDEQLKILAENCFSPILHAKPLHGKFADFHSCRLGRDYRIIYRFIDAKTILLISVKHRKDIYR